ncbi:MAG: PD-(D/E)XK nuclease family protein, partial [Elusimicrobiota bacterium]|nr:PD-(D/E)XK nuclease family protein [Elusimicrobiota bacterium]
NEKIIKILENNLLKKDIELNEKYKHKIKLFVNWLKNSDFQNKKNSILAVEKNFAWKVGDIFVRGTVDRIDKIGENEYIIIDYKTSEKVNEFEKDTDFDLTMNIYKHAVEEIFGLNIKGLKLIYPLCDKEISIKTEYKEFIKNKILKIVKKIEKNDKNCKICYKKNLRTLQI